MRKFLFLITSIFVLVLIFVPLTHAVPTITPELTVGPTDTLQPTVTPEVVGEVVIESEPTGVTEGIVKEEKEQKLDQKEVIGLILIGLLIVIIVIQALWDKFKKPPTANSPDPE